MITREDLKQSKMCFTMHADFSGFFQNHYANNRWPRLTLIVTNPRGTKSKAVFSKRFYVDGVEVTGCRELLERLNAPKLVAIEGGKAKDEEIHGSDGGVESQTRKELSADAQSLIAAGNVDSLGVAPGPSDLVCVTAKAGAAA